MARIWRDADIEGGAHLLGRVAILGYGSQGRAQALNLRDSGASVTIGVRSGGKGARRAEQDGFVPVAMEKACCDAEAIALLVPDSVHSEVVASTINEAAQAGARVVFAHGYSIHYGEAKLREDLMPILVAPKAIGPELRNLYVEGRGAAALVSAPDGQMDFAVQYAKALGCGRAAIIESSFREETETDLFGEQVVLCGGMPTLVAAAFETLVNAGYSPEAAYFECLFEVQLIANMMTERGIGGMFEQISDTAAYGAMLAGSEVINQGSLAAMERALERIRSGEFASLWREERRKGLPSVRKWLAERSWARLDETHAKLTGRAESPTSSAPSAEPASGESPPAES